MPGDEKIDENGAKVTSVEKRTSFDAARETAWKGAVKVVRRSFDDGALEQVYQSYCQRCRESDLDCFFLTGCLIAVHTAVGLSLEQETASLLDSGPRALAGAALSVVVAVAMASLGFYVRHRKQRAKRTDRLLESGGEPEAHGQADRLTYVAWTVANVLILAVLVAMPQWDSGSRALTWLLLVNFLTCITLPLRLRVCSALTVSASLIFVVLSACLTIQAPEEAAKLLDELNNTQSFNDSLPAVPFAPSFRQQVRLFGLKFLHKVAKVHGREGRRFLSLQAICCPSRRFGLRPVPSRVDEARDLLSVEKRAFSLSINTETRETHIVASMMYLAKGKPVSTFRILSPTTVSLLKDFRDEFLNGFHSFSPASSVSKAT